MRFLQGLKRYTTEKVLRFHTPGHRGGAWVHPMWRNYMGEAALTLDVSDVLSGECPGVGWHELLDEAQRDAAKLFKSGTTHFLINGTTGGLHAAIHALGYGRKVIFPRASHLSVYAGMTHARSQPISISPKYDGSWDIPGPPDVDAFIERSKSTYPELVVSTYPDYYGLATDLRAINQAFPGIHSVIDEAHGSHFLFCNDGPEPALALGSTVSVQSAHKTLGALTQASMLHTRRGAGDDVKRAVRRSLSLFESTSPSPFLLASLEASVSHLSDVAEHSFKEAMQLTSFVRRAIMRDTSFPVMTDTIAYDVFQARLDPLRVVVNVGQLGRTGLDVLQELRDRWNIQLELGNRRTVVALISSGNTEAECEQLVDAFVALSHESSGAPLPPLTFSETPPQKMYTWEALERPTVRRTIKGAVGHISAEYVVPYPPGIPLIIPGEEITPGIVEYMLSARGAGWDIKGIDDPEASTIWVIK